MKLTATLFTLCLCFILPHYGHALNITLSAEFSTNQFCDQWNSPGELCDPYAELWWSDDGIFFWRMPSTGHMPNTLNPVWPRVYSFPNEARVWNFNYGQIDDFLGYNRVSMSTLQNQVDNGLDWIGLDLIDPYGMGQHFGLLKVHIIA